MSRVVWKTAGALLTATVICSSSFAQASPIEFAGDRETPPQATESKPPAPSPSASDPTFRIRGRLQADALAADQTPENKAAFGNLTNVVGFRRARLGAEGTYGQQAAWVSEFDFADGDIRLRDVYLSLIDLPYVRRVRVGHFREPFGFEGQYSSNYFPLMERSVADNLNPARNWGAGFFSFDDSERITFASGVFWANTDSTGTAIGDSSHLAWTSRATGLLIDDRGEEGSGLIHLGLAFSYRPGQNTVSVNQEARSSLLDRSDSAALPFQPQLNIATTGEELLGLEWAASIGPFAFSAEWVAARIAQPGLPAIVYQGGYVMAAVFLTGERREYDRRAGAFKEVKVLRPFYCVDDPSKGFGPGAWELAVRMAYINYTDPNGPRNSEGQLLGVRAPVFTAGVNWYINDNVRFMFNYSYAVPSGEAVGKSSVSEFGFRAGVFW